MKVQPGDLVLAHGKGAFSTLIRFGQWLRPSWRPYKYWNHAAIVTSIKADGTIRCTQMSRRCVTIDLSEVSPGGSTAIFACPANVDRVRAVDYALRQVGVRYSVMTILSIAISLLTPKWIRFDFRMHGEALICSGLVARAWEHGGWEVPDGGDPYQVTPAELACWAQGRTTRR